MSLSHCFSSIVVKKLVKLATENPHVNPMDLPVTLDLDPKSPANQRGLAIRLFFCRMYIASQALVLGNS